MASVRKFHNTWQVRVSYKDKTGKRKSISKSGFKTKKMAQEYGTSLEYEYGHGGQLEDKNVGFVNYFIDWYQTYREPSLSENTKTKYIYTINVITEFFGETRLNDVTRSAYQNFLNVYGQGDDTKKHPAHAKATVEKVNTHIRAAVENAVNDGVINRDFTMNTKVVYDKKHTREIKYLNEIDAKRLISYLKTHLNDSVVFGMCYTGLVTGMRASEVAGLTWDCIDKENLTLDINKSWNFKQFKFGPTKNPSSTRVIEIIPDLISVLAHVKFLQNTQLKLKHQQNKKNLVFMTKAFTVPDYNTINKELRVALQGAGIKQDLTFHGLRHTHASLLLYDKIAIPYISKRLGHKNVDTTIKTYLHITQELQSKESEKTILYLNKLTKTAN
ncbi:integrase [Lentilactobacillus fungorum]|uniref:Integrase n=1 Tax=Lentilactobacillus fungorum TaxID=2201250 RepID=A0ABQ3VXV2_9LACO|nr:site-specific integrase [Lentilactobacillus fungorum]GHP13735.1 integrase [Lentilactobacillus fungorum]